MRIRNKKIYSPYGSSYVYEITPFNIPGMFSQIKYAEEFYEKYIYKEQSTRCKLV